MAGLVVLVFVPAVIEKMRRYVQAAMAERIVYLMAGESRIARDQGLSCVVTLAVSLLLPERASQVKLVQAEESWTMKTLG